MKEQQEINCIEKAIEHLKERVMFMENFLKEKESTGTIVLDKEKILSSMAINKLSIAALEKQLNGGWILVSEGAPNMDECHKNDNRFIVTDGNRVYEDSFDYLADGYTEPKWIYSTMCEPIAWQPLPEPFKED